MKNSCPNLIDSFRKFEIYFYFLIISLCFTSNFYSQTILTGQVLSSEDARPISAAIIIDTINNNTVKSDSLGFFKLNTFGKVRVQADGFEQTIFNLSLKKSNTIFLKVANTQLDEVIINAVNIPERQRLSSQAISALSENDLKLQNSHDLASTLNTMTGIFMQSGTLNTNRISIRGIGARNLFGTANIRAYFGDIPLTDGNGESSIEDLELQAMSNITVLKGPSASSFGVGLGGTILLEPSFADYGSSDANASLNVGSYGFLKSIISAKIGLEKSNFNVVYSDTHSAGYRVNNEYDRKTMTITSRLLFNDKNEITVLASYIDLKGGIPSSLTESDFDENPRQAAFTWGQSRAFEDLKYGLLGLSWKYKLNKNTSLLTSVNTSTRENYEPRPFNILSETSTTLGLRSRILGTIPSEILKIECSFGGELFYDFYKNSTFQNLYQQFEDNRGSVKGSQLTGFDERRSYLNLFLESNVKINEKFKVNVGLHLNKTNFKLKDNFDGTILNNNGIYDFKTILSPKIGFNYEVSESLISFGNISHGFSTPTTAETLLPDGVFNSNLKPEIGWNFETGLRYYFFENKLYGNVSIYSLQISDLLVSRRTQEDDFFAINAGKSSHNGIEADLNYKIFQNEKYKLVVNSNISINDYRFTKFIDNEIDFSGKRVTGVPKSVANIQLILDSKSGFYGRLAYQRIGKIFANDTNSVFNDEYTLINGKIGYNVNVFKSLNLDFSVSGNNLFNEKYASQLQINAAAFGANQPRYFYPGLPANYYANVRLSYQF